jgi:signal transduction histidine kinase
VNNLLDYARMEAGNFRVAPAPTPLGPVVQGVLGNLAPLAEKKDLNLSWRPEPGLPEVLADAFRMEQVLTNLVGNAIKFTPQGGTVTVSAAREDGHVRVAVTDTGIGIAPEALPHLFTKFYQVDSSATRAYGGTGLGLAIVKSLVEAMGGTVSVASTEGQGSTFSFTLAIAPVAPPAA